MAAKSLDIHPSALAELKSSISWYLEQNETTAAKFVEEIDRAIDLVLASPGDGRRVTSTPGSLSPSFSLCGDLPRKEISG
jgi:plasmid stabilization system protein ParE